MTPAARLSAAIELIETIDAQRVPAAKALKEWGTAHRFAGSGDRAAIAGLIWDVLRRRASSAWIMEADTPRARVLGRHVLVASVRCAVSCHAWVAVSLLRKHSSAGERVGWTANTVIDGSESIGVWGAIPTGRVAVTINVGDGPFVQGHSMITAGSRAAR